MSSKKRSLLIAAILVTVLLFDYITKLWARGPLLAEGPFTWLGGAVRFESVENPGAFLSLGAGLSEFWRQALFQGGVVITLLITAWLLWKRSWASAGTVGLTFILAGGIGNLIDRVMKGTVTDFVIVGLGAFRTGVFNVADVAIMLGLLLVLWPEPKKA